MPQLAFDDMFLFEVGCIEVAEPVGREGVSVHFMNSLLDHERNSTGSAYL
jgi:hypothetical protein